MGGFVRVDLSGCPVLNLPNATAIALSLLTHCDHFSHWRQEVTRLRAKDMKLTRQTKRSLGDFLGVGWTCVCSCVCACVDVCADVCVWMCVLQ